MKKTNSLSPTDWIMAGFRALVTGGVQAIKVEAIAKSLKVSKGSFYWHFKDVSTFKSEMLEHWKNIATHDIISTFSTNTYGLDSKEKLRSLIQIATSDLNEPYGGPLVEPAIRNWARYDKNVAMVLDVVDTARLGFVKALFEEIDPDPAQCHSFARILYAALIGLEQLPCLDSDAPQKELNKLLNLMFQKSDV